jgi:hypothetical protein
LEALPQIMGAEPRKHVKGLDISTAEPLSAAKNAEAVLRDQAKNHERHRLESVAEAFVLVSTMTHRKALSGREKIGVRGAVFQFGCGVQKDNSVAAHCLPGGARRLPILIFPNFACI